jgi:hypothetical protein
MEDISNKKEHIIEGSRQVITRVKRASIKLGE